jgi:hypothetical protein
MYKRRQIDIYAGLIPSNDTVVFDNKPTYIDPMKTSNKMEPKFVEHKPEQLEKLEEQPETKQVISDVKIKKPPKKRNNSIKGETVNEITNNIIKEKPNIKKVQKAFEKMAKIVQDEYDLELYEM